MFKRGVKSFIEYETPRYVKIHNPLLGIVLRSSQLGIITYIITYALLYERGYQAFSDVESSVITKVKGTTSSSVDAVADNSSEHKTLYERVWDEADYVVPPAENGAFFITTNVLISPNQTQSHCAEDKFVAGASCSRLSSSCEEGAYLHQGHGRMTGVCLEEGVCEISGWCPVEQDREPHNPPVLKDAEDFTVYIKNSISFPQFGETYRKNNLIYGSRPSFFSPVSNPYGQIFRIGDLVEWAGGNFSLMAVKGGVISVTILWQCDLDWDFDNCLPRYQFSLLEKTGWNFRHAYYHELARRTLLKAYGLKFIIQVEGYGCKFSMKNTILNIGNGLALLGITTVLCEFVLMHFIQEKKSVAQKKYDTVEPISSVMKSFLGASAPLMKTTEAKDVKDTKHTRRTSNTTNKKSMKDSLNIKDTEETEDTKDMDVMDIKNNKDMKQGETIIFTF